MSNFASPEHTFVAGGIAGSLLAKSGPGGWRVDVETDDAGDYTNVVVLELPNGNRYRVTVDFAGGPPLPMGDTP